MTKTIILGIAAAAVLITGIIAFIPEAISDPKVSEERDNTTVTGLTTPSGIGKAIVLLDNAGIGGTSDVEVTWTGPFSDGDCRLVTLGGSSTAPGGPGPIPGTELLGNDGAFSTAITGVAHADVAGTNAILLVDTIDDNTPCVLGTDFISISTVGSEASDDDDDD